MIVDVTKQLLFEENFIFISIMLFAMRHRLKHTWLTNDQFQLKSFISMQENILINIYYNYDKPQIFYKNVWFKNNVIQFYRLSKSFHLLF